MIDMHKKRNDRVAHARALARLGAAPTRMLDRLGDILWTPSPATPRLSEGRLHAIEVYWRLRVRDNPRDVNVVVAGRHTEALIAEIRRQRVALGQVHDEDIVMRDIHGDDDVECDSNGGA